MSVPINPGDVIDGRYVIERLLGEGGMGAVFIAREDRLGRRVAIKVLLSAVADNPEAMVRFEREARSAAVLQSDHVTRVLSVGHLASGGHIVMELLEGEDLAQILAQRGALSPHEVIGFMTQVCDALSEAHALGIVHRDLKPANVFLSRRPGGGTRVKVLDFGISKGATGTVSTSLTNTTALMGTPLYMSPEQLREARNVDGRADVWALGAMMYELLAGKPPFVSESLTELCVLIMTTEHEPLIRRRPDIPLALDAIVNRCLQKEPAGRFATAQELVAALAAVPLAGSQPAPPARMATPRMNPMAAAPTEEAARARAQAPTEAARQTPLHARPPQAPLDAPRPPPQPMPTNLPPGPAQLQPVPVLAGTVDPVISTQPWLPPKRPNALVLGLVFAAALVFGARVLRDRDEVVRGAATRYSPRRRRIDRAPRRACRARAVRSAPRRWHRVVTRVLCERTPADSASGICGEQREAFASGPRAASASRPAGRTAARHVSAGRGKTDAERSRRAQHQTDHRAAFESRLPHASSEKLMRRPIVLVALVLAASLTPALARAQDSAGAEALFQKGHQLFEAKDYAAACPKFAESFRLDPVTGSLLALAACHEAEGKLASAWAEYIDVATRARREGKNDRADAAQQRAGTLEPKLAKLTIALGPGAEEIAGLQVKRDGIVVGAGAFGTPLPVDKGEHTIEATAPGRQPFTRRLTVQDGAAETIPIPALAQGGKAAVPPSQPPPPTSGEFPLRTVGIIAGAAGLISASIGGYFGAQALSKNSDSNANNHCVNDKCDSLGKQTRLDAISAGNTSTILFVVGGVLIAGGVALFIVGGSARAGEAKPAVAAAPFVGPGSAGVGLSGRF